MPTETRQALLNGARVHFEQAAVRGEISWWNAECSWRGFDGPGGSAGWRYWTDPVVGVMGRHAQIPAPPAAGTPHCELRLVERRIVSIDTDRCWARNCHAIINPLDIMCPRHWDMLSPQQKGTLVSFWRPGYSPTGVRLAYLMRCIDAVANIEGSGVLASE